MKKFQQETDPASELLPRHLSTEEIDDPRLVLQKFFDIVRLPQAREFMWELLKAVVTGEYVKMTVRERSNLLFGFEQLQRLIEGAHILHVNLRLDDAGQQASSN